MKKIFLVASAFVVSLASRAQAQVKADDVAKFNVETHDFGKVKQGTPVTYAFEIKNISDKPLVVENSYASCGCTTPEKITEPIMPGATVPLKVQYNAANMGPINKDVFIQFAGVTGPKTVHITGEVVSIEDYDKWVKENKEREKNTSKTKEKEKDKPNN